VSSFHQEISIATGTLSLTTMFRQNSLTSPMLTTSHHHRHYPSHYAKDKVSVASQAFLNAKHLDFSFSTATTRYVSRAPPNLPMHS
jgi:hypothetical protein